MHNRGCWDLERYTPDGLREHLDYAPKPHSSCTDWLTVRPLRGERERTKIKKTEKLGVMQTPYRTDSTFLLQRQTACTLHNSDKTTV